MLKCRVIVLLGFLCLPVAAQSFYPHAIGNKWRYSDSLSIEIPGTTTLQNGTNVYKFQAIKTFEGTTDTFYYYQNIAGNEIHQFHSLDDVHVIVLLRGPYATGTRWIDTNPQGEPIDTLEIIEATASLSTPAGNFTNCLKIKSYNNGNIAYLWYAPNVGFLKIQNSEACEGGCGDKELISYTIN